MSGRSLFAADGSLGAGLLLLEREIRISRPVSGPAVEVVQAPAGVEIFLALSPLAQNRIGCRVEFPHERRASFDAGTERHGGHGGAQLVATSLQR